MKYQAPVGAADQNAPYVDGNPGTGTEGSPVPAKAIEHPMREIVRVITGAGLTPSESDTEQLWAALQALLSSKISNSEFVAGSDHFQLPGGWLVQMDYVNEATPGSGGGSVVFPTAYNEIKTVVLGPWYPGGTSAHDIGGVSISDRQTTGFSWVNTNDSLTAYVNWLAIGKV